MRPASLHELVVQHHVGRQRGLERLAEMLLYHRAG